MERDVSLTDLQLRNEQLNDQLEHMEKVLTAKVSSAEVWMQTNNCLLYASEEVKISPKGYRIFAV